MKVEIKFSVRDLTGNMRDGAYDIAEGSAVAGLLDASQREAGRVLSEEVKKSFIFMVNGKSADWETVLKEGDKVRVLYKILGG